MREMIALRPHICRIRAAGRGQFDLAFSTSAIRTSADGSMQHHRPFRVAVIGSGPAGFYTTYRLMSRIQPTKVDMYESLPVPFGLVRFGVAPDHPEVKNCQDKFEEVASSPDFTFIGNVHVGQAGRQARGGTVPLASLLRHYHAVVFAYGASRDRKLDVAGERLRGVYSAREFVGWYNGLPEYAKLAPELCQGEDAVVIGHGNVALDVARILLQDVAMLRKSDMTGHALEILSQSKVKRVHVVGRRGPMQAAFTIKEIRELMKLSDVAFHAVDKSLIPLELESLPRPSRRLMDVLVKGSPSSPAVSSRSWSLDCCLTPKRFVAERDDGSRLAYTDLERSFLSDPFDPKAYVTGTEKDESKMVRIPSQIAFRSIGYKSEPLAEFSGLAIPFDEKGGIISNDGLGRVLHEERGRDAAMGLGHFPGLYCAGWVKRGPTGVIASTMTDAFTTADTIAHDRQTNAAFLGHGHSVAWGWQGVQGEMGKSMAPVVRWQDWLKIDRAEKERGRRMGKEREKFTTIQEMLAVLD